MYDQEVMMVMYDQEVMTAYQFLDNEDNLNLVSGRALNALCLFQVYNYFYN